MALTVRSLACGTSFALLVVSWVVACGDSTTSDGAGQGGVAGQANTTTSGVTVQGGSSATGGATAQAGSVHAGGSATGGSVATQGGSVATGGSVAVQGGNAGTLSSSVAVAGTPASGGNPGAAGSSATTVAAAGAPAVDCGSGSNTAPVITGQHSTAAFPAALGLTGGATTIPNGTYFRTAVIYYEKGDNGADSSQFQGTIIVQGNTVRQWNRPLPDDETHMGATFTINGTSLSIVGVCPAGFAGNTSSMPFTFVPPGTFKTYEASSKKESVFTLQP